MAALLETLNITREETISDHYGAASAELKHKIQAEPLRTTFNIFSGCVSKEITTEISHRFNAAGLKTNIVKSGIVSTTYSLSVEVALPEHLLHAQEKEENKEEMKEAEKLTEVKMEEKSKQANESS